MKQWLLAILLGVAGGRVGAAYDPAATGAWTVVVNDGTWRDASRDREVPYRLYQPAGATGRCPLIVFSHGLGGTRAGYAHLGQCWASHGYLSLHLQHPGSDDAVWRGQARPMQNMRAATRDGRSALDRARDVSFALDQVLADPALAARVDTNALGLAGHSFGSWTVLAAAGQRLGPLEDRLADRRFKAGIAMSSPVPARLRDDTYADIRMPLLHMTGTEDVSPINDTTAAQRRVPYDRIAAPSQYLVTFEGGDHMIFGGREGPSRRPRDAEFHALIHAGSLAFWDAYLRGDGAARRWLDEGGYAVRLGTSARYERK